MLLDLYLIKAVDTNSYGLASFGILNHQELIIYHILWPVAHAALVKPSIVPFAVEPAK
jgi:hypothetical protein